MLIKTNAAASLIYINSRWALASVVIVSTVQRREMATLLLAERVPSLSLTDGATVPKQGSGGLSLGQSMFVVEQAGRFKDYYQLAERLGTGAFGEVRKCVNRKTGHVRAVKVLLKSNIDTFDT